MALSRFLILKPVLHCHASGIAKSTRCISSSSSNGGTQDLSRVKGVKGGKENELMEMDLKGLPKVKEVEMKVGGPWYSLKNIFTNFKDRMLRNPQSHKQVSSDTTLSAADSTASEVITTQTGVSKHFAESRGSDNVRKASEIPTDSNCRRDYFNTRNISFIGETPLEDAVNTTASADMKMHVSLDNTKHDEHDSTTVQAASSIISDDTTLSASEVITTQTGVSKHFAESRGSDNVPKASEIPTDSNCRRDYFNTRNISYIGETPLEDAVNTTASADMKMHVSLDNTKHDEHDSTTVQAASSIISDDPKEVMLENGKRLLEEASFGTIVESNNNQEEAGNLVSLADHLFDNAIDTRKNKSANKSASIRKEKCQLEKKTATIVEGVNIDGSKLDKRPSLSGGSKGNDGIVNLFKMSVSNKTAAETGTVNGDLLTPSISFSNHDGKSLKKEESPFDFKGLYGHIKTMRLVTAQDNAMCTIDNIQFPDELMKSNAESRKTVLKGRAVSKNSKKRSKIEKEQRAKIMKKDEGGNLDIAEKDNIKLENTPQVPLETSEKDSNQLPLTCLADGQTENKLLLRFLHKDVGDGDIISCFRNCRPISKIKKVSSVKGSHWFDAFLHFETRQGLHMALEKPEVMVKNSNAFIDETSLDTAKRISIPNLIGDIDIPVALVKNPTRTVKIKQLTNDISSHQLKEALSFCGSGINGFFLGSSSSNAYVEFESEDAKERALAKHFLQVSGKQLSIFRVDAPRTTVVRILNINPQCRSNVPTICKSFGKLWRMKLRHENIADVYFKIDEWPNMLNILNSLNGLEVDGSRWVAQPASIFPPIILQALWNHPDERRHVITLMQDLLKKVGHPMDTAELKNLAARFCGDNL